MRVLLLLLSLSSLGAVGSAAAAKKAGSGTRAACGACRRIVADFYAGVAATAVDIGFAGGNPQVGLASGL